MRVFDFDRAIVRQPSPSVVNGLRAGDHEGPTFDGIRREHAAYLDVLRAAGLELTVLPALADFPDSIFVEDPALVFPEGAILLRPGAPSREGEAAELGGCLRAHFAVVLDLPGGHVDGGDVLVLPDRVLVGRSARTDEAGASALLGLLGQLGRKGVVTRTPAGTLHFKSACALVDEETVLAMPELAATGVFAGYRVLAMPEGEESGASVLRLNDVVLAGSAFPRTRELLAGHGIETVPLETAQVGRIDAGLTCMSLRWRKAASP